MIKNHSSNIWKHLISPILGFLVIFYVWISLNVHAKILGAAWILIGIIYYIILKFILKRKPEELNV
ncbi:hypothetical protein [Thermoanaerobacter thermohydrosulfuricus]|nr:hypothetical protein [Thermoanaerobacter thermohydrosulfuricus]